MIFEFRARRHQMNGLRELKVTTTAIIETVWVIEDLALTLTWPVFGQRYSKNVATN